jgi:pimeloyl-ACP methyl ester carboxylesterase
VPGAETRYAKRGEISIAYQVVGDGPIDVVLVNGLCSHVELFWIEPEATAMLRALGSFSRLILFDKPGTGLSDPVAGAPTIEQRVQDVRAVMDAAGSERAVVIGWSEGGPISAVFAATYPQRVEALILLSTAARLAEENVADYLPEIHDKLDSLWRAINQDWIPHWGEGRAFLDLAPSWGHSETYRRLAPIAERACASPGMVRAIVDGIRKYDVRAILPTIGVPTLVLHYRDEWTPVEMGRDLATRIPGARYIEFEGEDHVAFAGDWRPLVGEIEQFVTGHRADPERDRVLQTVLFTDIVGSTKRAAALGDREWRRLLERHDDVVREELARHRGRPIKSLGDGFFAAFDGAARAIRCARAICDATRELGVDVRAGVHTGECELRGDDLSGLTVHIGARIGALAGPGEVLVSGTVCDLVVGSGIEFLDRGVQELKGVPGRWRVCAVADDAAAGARPVSRVDPEIAALTPGPTETMKRIDRVAVRIAKHAPAVPRFALRVTRRPARTPAREHSSPPVQQ